MRSIKLKLLILIGLSVIVCSTVLIYRTYTSVTSYVGNLTNQQLQLALNFDLAIREYVAEKVRPVMFDLVDEGKFIPETMSTSFVARSIFEKVQHHFPNYIIKFASGNPRNPLNQAGPEELNMIRYFNDHPDNSIWTGGIAIGDRKYIATFSAMRMKKACLRCHGDPKDAPIELIKRYGPDASFYRPLGEVVGMDTIAIPSDIIKNQIISEKFKNIGFLGAVILLLSASLIFIFKFVITDRLTVITDHFLDLEKLSKKLKIRNIDIKGQDEIAILAKSFNKLVTKLNKKYVELTLENERRKQVQKALLESEEKYRKLFEMESDALVLFDFETHEMLDVNNALVELYGYSREKILCMKVTDLSAEPDKTLDSIQKGETYIRNRYHKKKNGEVFPVEITTNFYEYKGRNVYLASIRDITDRKTIEQQIEASLKEKEILLSEIHHRVKNNFEIISSLLDMASMGSENKEVKNLLLSSRTRIHSMAMIHSHLYQSDWFDRVEMVKHIKGLSENLKFLYKNEKKIKIEIKPSEVYLSLKQAIPCALIINELITNSLKYAFVGKKHGKIHVSMSDSNDNKMLLRVKDDGAGFGESVGVKPAGSLGLELVNHLVLGQLKGEISIHHNDGTDICIEFKRQ